MSKVAHNLEDVSCPTTKAKHKPYPAYRDSGVEWLGEVPEEWKVEKFKYHIDYQEGPGIMADDFVDSGVPLLRIHNVQGVFVNLEGCNYLDPNKVMKRWNHFRLKCGDLLISCSASTGTLSEVTDESEGSIAYTGIIKIGPSDKTIRQDFIKWIVSSEVFFTQIELLKTGTTIQHFGPAHLGKMFIPLPKITEQQSIADFLYERTTKIDALIEKKQRLIELLKEKRTALISHAVTKGLDPNVKMKDSGVEWLGEVPEGWEIAPTKRYAVQIQTGSTPSTSESGYYDSEDIAWYGPGSFTDELILSGPVKYLSKSAINEGAARLFKKGSTFIVCIGATTGKVGFLDDNSSCNQQITSLSFQKERLLPKYIAYQFKRLEPTLRGIAPRSTLPILDNVKISYLPIVLPSTLEQEGIVDMIDQETSIIDALIDRVRAAVDKLKEYRTALISAAVTGKIDVRDK